MESNRDALTLSWLLRLRWAALLGAVLLVSMLGPAMHLAFPLRLLVPLAVVMGLSNGMLQLLASRLASRAWSVLAAVLLLDGILLTVALYATGGAANPFTASYLLLVVLAAATLGRRAGVVAVACAVAAVVTIAVFHEELQADHDHAAHDHRHAAEGHVHPGHDEASEPHGHAHTGHHVETPSGNDHLRLHAQGTGLVFAVLAGLVVYLVSWALRQREAQLEALVAARQRSERLADLGAFASSAAHELGSPLATIAVVAKELERALQRAGDPAGTVADAQTIRRQVGRCREVLDELAKVARGEGSDAAEPIAITELLAEAKRLAPEPDRVHCSVAAAAEPAQVLAPRGALLQVMRGIVANAQQAAPESTVRLVAEVGDGRARIAIHDEGPGMAAELVERAGEEPVVSRQGLGVGLFVGRAILERLGGTMTIDSRPGRGTSVTLSLPLSEAA